MPTTAAFSQHAPTKPKNGDAYCIIGHQSGATVLILADGYGFAPCDWKAAQTAAEELRDAILPVRTVTKELLQTVVEKAGKTIQDVFGICAGLKTAISVVVMQPNGKIFAINLGGNLLFKWRKSRLEILDIQQYECYLGEVIPELEVFESSITAEEGILLVSSGIVSYQGRNFLSDFEYLFSKDDPDKNLPLLMKKYTEKQEDDCTALILMPVQT